MCFLSAVIQAKSVGDNLFQLVYNGDGPPDGYLYITSKGEGQEVIVTVSNHHFKTIVSGTRAICLPPCISSLVFVITFEASQLPKGLFYI